MAPLQQAIALDNRAAEAHYLLALCLRSQSDDKGALAALGRAVEIDAAFIEAREELGGCLRAGRTAAARNRAARGTSRPRAPTEGERLIGVGLAYARWGRTEAAIVTLGRAAERFPDRADVYVALGRVWLDVAESGNDRAALGKAMETLQPHAIFPGASFHRCPRVVRPRTAPCSGDAARRGACPPSALRLEGARRPSRLSLSRRRRRASRSLPPQAHDALVRYAALVDDNDLDPTINERLARLENG